MALAVTSPIQVPSRPKFSVTENSHAKGAVKTMVRKTVKTSEYTPFPAPWNIDDESIPNPTAG